MFFSTGGTGFIATDMTGTTLWTGIPTPPDGAVNPYFAAEAFTISGSSMLLTVDAYVGHGSTASTMNVFPIDGCGAPQCAPARTIDPTSNTDGSGRWSASGNVVLRRSGGLTAWDLTTGAALWSTAAPQRTPVRTRDARVFASTTTGTDVFDATGVAGCAGAPKICAPLAHFAAPDISAASDHVAVALAENPDNKVAVQLFPADPGACPTAPTPCAPFATTNLIGPVSGYHSVAITRNLVFVATDILGFFTETPHLFAFDAAGVANCAGSPDICSPLVDLIMPEGAGSGQITVWDGRVYVPGSDGALNVFGLPGDVS